jgi:hypothetical protein
MPSVRLPSIQRSHCTCTSGVECEEHLQAQKKKRASARNRTTGWRAAARRPAVDPPRAGRQTGGLATQARPARASCRQRQRPTTSCPQSTPSHGLCPIRPPAPAEHDHGRGVLVLASELVGRQDDGWVGPGARRHAPCARAGASALLPTTSVCVMVPARGGPYGIMLIKASTEKLFAWGVWKLAGHELAG